MTPPQESANRFQALAVLDGTIIQCIFSFINSSREALCVVKFVATKGCKAMLDTVARVLAKCCSPLCVIYRQTTRRADCPPTDNRYLAGMSLVSMFSAACLTRGPVALYFKVFVAYVLWQTCPTVPALTERLYLRSVRAILSLSRL